MQLEQLKEKYKYDKATPVMRQFLDVKLFEVGQAVDVTGESKGKGFQGVIKRYGFAGGPATHGSHFHRRPGSVGMKEWPGRVLKGKKLPGRMGNQQVTLRDRTVMACDTEKGLIAIKGPIPGPNGSSVYLTLNNDN